MALSKARYPIDTNNQLSQLFFAIEKRCHNKVEQILKSGFDVNHVIRSSKNQAAVGRTALHHACDCRNESAVKLLLEFGADITVKDHNGHTALRLCTNHYRIRNKDTFIKLILDVHVDKEIRKNPVDNFNLSHFHLAHATKHERATAFFKEFCSLDGVVHKDSPYLSNYSISNDFSRYEFHRLLDNEEEIPEHESKNQHDLSRAVRIRRDEIMSKWLPEDFSSDPVDELMTACLKGSPEEVKNILLESGTVNSSGEDISEKALYLASHAKSIDNVKVLIEHGANFFVDFAGHQILDLCTEMFGWRVLELLPLLDSLDELCILEKRVREFCLTALNPAKQSLLKVDYFLKLKLRAFVNSLCVSSNSRIWREASPLHLIVKFSRDRDESNNCSALKLDEYQRSSIIIIRQLLSYGADYTIQDADGRTLLHQASHSGYLEFYTAILKSYYRGSPTNPIDDSGLSHLHVACFLDDATDFDHDFDRDDVNVNTKINCEIEFVMGNSTINVSSGSTPLHAAVVNYNRTRNRTIVEWLIKRGADIFAEDVDGLTPVHYLAMYHDDKNTYVGWEQIIEEFFSHQDIKTANPTCATEGLSHLQAACATDKVEVIEALVELGANVNAPPPCSVSKNINIKKNVFTTNTPLLIAYKFNNQKTLEVLAKHGANFNAPNSNGLSCLHVALANWLEGCPRQKVKKVVDLMKFDWRDTAPIDRTGLTQLHVACALGIINSVKKQVQAGADVNKPISTKSSFLPGLTPILATVMFCKFESKEQYLIIMKILLRNGANPLCNTLDNDTAIHLAYKLNKPELVDLMLANGKIVRSNPKNDFGLSHFHVACAVSSEKVVTRFLEYGVDVNEPVSIFFKGWDKSKYEQVSKCTSKTPLHLSINAENDSSKAIMSALLSRGANPNAQDRKGWTPLQYACETDNLDLVKILLRSDEIDIDSTDACGDTALHILLSRPKVNKEILRLLLSRGISIDAKSFECAVKKRDAEISSLIVTLCKDISFTDKITGSNAIHKIVENTVGRVTSDLALDWTGRFSRNSTWQKVIVHSKDRGEKEDSQVCTELSKDKLYSLVWLLSKRGVDIDGKDSKGKTPLHVAVKYYHNEAVEVLLNNGADFEIDNCDPLTNIQLANSTRAASIFQTFKRHLYCFEKVGKDAKLAKYLVESPAFHYCSRLGIGTVDEPDPIEKVMMETTVLSKDFSLYNMLTASERRAEKCVNNSRLLEILNSQTFLKDYPTLGGVLKFQYRTGCKRRKMKELAGAGLSRVSEINLVEPCVEAIASYLSLGDLENLAKLSE